MSRVNARRTLSMDDYHQAMEGIFATSVNTYTLDESPMAYKALDEIIGIIGQSVEIIDVMKPVYNFKYHGWLGEEKDNADRNAE